MSNTQTFRKGDTYKQFTVLSVFELSDFHSTAVHLRHNKTGLEVLHLVNDEMENLFAFAFRTPNDKANGAAHILEHSVLCGSEKYPLKDPFIHLSNQSVKTYLNAMTYPDRTVFPASSTVKADYFNLMSVYGDAVFFPLLSPEIFMQEAWRPELDADGSVSIQGVVYNEMKGSYSSFESVAADYALNSLVKGCIYEKDSGGDPLVIPSITHEDLVAFHDRWYRPNNCLVFLYGNIDTTEQLDFLQTEFLDRLEKKYANVTVTPTLQKELLGSYIRAVTPHEQIEPITLYAQGPAGEDKDDLQTVLVNWRLPPAQNAEQTLEYMILSGILLNHDGSPLQKVLLESGLGEDVAPQTGLDGSLYHCAFTAGLRGVAKGDETKVQDVILQMLEKLSKDGIPQEDIAGTMMSLEYSQREIRRAHGPYSLRLMGNAVHSWVYGFDVQNGFRLRADLERVRQRIETEKGYLENRIQALFLQNVQRSLVVVTPTQKYTQDRDEAEQKLIEQLLKTVCKEDIKRENDALHAFQSTAEDISCLPHLRPRDFLYQGKPVLDRITTEIASLRGVDGSEIPYFKNCEHTNGIIYAEVAFPADVLPVADYALLPLFAEAATECGWGALSWAQSAQATSLHTGGISMNLLVAEQMHTERAKAYAAGKNWVGREWVVYRMSMIEEEAENALNLLADCIVSTDFKDTKRLQDIATELRNDIDASIIPDGHDYAAMRTKRTISRVKAIDELWNGLSSLYSIHRYSEDDIARTAGALRAILAALRAGGAFVHVTAEQKGIERFSELLPAFIEKTALVAPKTGSATSAQHAPTEAFIALTEIEGKGDASEGEVLMTSAQVGFAAETIASSPYGTRESAAEEVCTHLLSNTLLWERLRTIGGAYGTFCYTDIANIVVFSTYRDPTPERSNSIFESCLEEASQQLLDEESVERAITGCYSGFVQPKSPGGRGAVGLLHALFAIQDDDREDKVRNILTLTAEDLKKGFATLAAFAGKTAKKAIICAQNTKSSGKKTVLPL